VPSSYGLFCQTFQCDCGQVWKTWQRAPAKAFSRQKHSWLYRHAPPTLQNQGAMRRLPYKILNQGAATMQHFLRYLVMIILNSLNKTNHHLPITEISYIKY